MKVDPIIAVKDVEASSNWYYEVFDLRSMHARTEFDILVDKNGEVALCLHVWAQHDHPTMQSINKAPGNGFILYFRIKNLNKIRSNLSSMNHPLEQEIDLNPNSHRKEFSFRDPEGYYLTVSEFYNYEG